jgi:hypothetical protein
MTRYSIFMWLLGFVLLTGSCSTATLTGSWRNPLFAGQFETVYVVGLSNDETGRRIFEDRFVAGLADYEVTGLASYHDFPSANQTSKKIIAEKIVANRTDTLLISRIIGKRTEEVISPGRVAGYTYGPYYGRPDYYRPYPYYGSWPSYYDYSYTTVFEPPTITRFDVVTIESTLYDILTGGLIWSAQIESVIDSSLEKLISDFVETVLTDLHNQGLI